MKLYIEIQLGNEAMSYAPEVVDAINRSFGTHAVDQEQHDWQPLAAADEGVVMDKNGNAVGRWDVLASDSETVFVDGLNAQTVLTNGSALAEVYTSVRGDLEASRLRLKRAEQHGTRKGESLRAMRENEARMVGKLQGYKNLLTLLGVDTETLMTREET